MLKPVLAFFLSLVLPGLALMAASLDSPETRKARDRMVRDQFEARGISMSRVIEAMRSVPRHQFVPEDLVGSAYNDHPLPIGEGQTISQPYIVALMTEVLQLKPTDRVLEIGTGSGYQAAVLSGLAAEVYTIEIKHQLHLNYFVRGKPKVLIGLARGKKAHDKRDTIKEKESRRELERVVKERNR